MRKYRNKSTILDGITFHSKREANYYSELKLREKAGEISDLILQPSVTIVINEVKVCKIIADFRFTERGNTRIIDVKGFDTPVSKLKRKLFYATHGVEIEIVK